MKDIKSIISAKVKEGAHVYKNVGVENLSPYGEVKNGRQGYIMTLNKPIRAMVSTSDVDTTELEEAVMIAKAEVEAATDAATKTAAEAKLAEAQANLAAIENEDYVINERDFIFTSNFELLGVIKHNTQLRFMYKMAQVDESLLEEIYVGSTVNILAEDVIANQEYVNPFRFTNDGKIVLHDSVYHAIYNLIPGDEAMEAVEDCRSIKRELRKDLLKEAMRNGRKRPAIIATDDEDDED